MKSMEEKAKFRDCLLLKSEVQLLEQMNSKTKFSFWYENNTVISIILHEEDNQSVREEIIAFPNLESIDFSDKEVPIVPSWLNQCPSLKTLHFSNKNPQDFETLAEITNLESLFLSKCHLTDLPLALESLTNLRQLDLSFNSFEHIPEVIQYFPNLESLYMGYNALTRIPDWISETNQNLKYVDFDHNSLNPYPPQLNRMENLETISLARNNIAIIPDNIINLSNLKCLALTANRINMLPSCIINLNNLEVIYLENNPIDEDELEHITTPLRNNGCHIYFF